MTIKEQAKKQWCSTCALNAAVSGRVVHSVCQSRSVVEDGDKEKIKEGADEWSGCDVRPDSLKFNSTAFKLPLPLSRTPADTPAHTLV